MTIEEAIKILKDGRKNLYGALDKSVSYEQQHTLVTLDMAIKSLEAWEKVKEELKESSYERYFEFGEYIGEDTQKIRIIGFDTAIDIINKHLAEVSE